MTSNEIDIKIMVRGFGWNNSFLCNCEEFGCKIHSGQGQYKLTPDKGLKPQHFGKVEAVAFIV